VVRGPWKFLSAGRHSLKITQLLYQDDIKVLKEVRRRGEDKVDIPHDVMERIGQQADPATQTRLGVASNTEGESVRLAARQRAAKAATVLQYVTRMRYHSELAGTNRTINMMWPPPKGSSIFNPNETWIEGISPKTPQICKNTYLKLDDQVRISDNITI
jgi:hypothetical protein